jgi:transposase
VGSLVEKLVEFSKQCDHITLVFDGGNNSQENIESLDSSNYHFITSLTLSHHADLLEIGVKNFESFSNPRLQGTSAYRTQKQVWGKNRTLVITRSEELYRGQIAGIEQCLQKRRRAMRILRAKLLRSHARKKGKGYTQDSLDKHLKELTSGQYITEILKTRIFKDAKGRLDFRFWTDPNAYRRLQSTRLGKRILCTDNHHWQTEEIILASRAQSHIERAFRQMKNPHWVSFSPTFHWTDQKLRVHVFYCVLALTLVCLLQREASQKGIELSVPELMKELTKIKEVASFYASGKSGKAGALRSEYVLTETNAEQKKLIQAFQIEKLRHP